MVHKTLQFIFFYIIIYKPCIFSWALIGQNVREAEQGEFSAAVPILRVINDGRPPELSYACSGTLITNRDVISSAHCLENEQLSEIKVLIGSNDLRGGQEYFPQWWITYAEWVEEQEINSQFQNNDLCIMRLSRNVSLINIQPATIIKISRTRLYQSEVEVIGWGKIQTDQVPRMLQTVALNVLNNSICMSLVRNIRRHDIHIPENNLCTVATPCAFVSPGDSGGSLFLRKRILVGVTRAVCPNMQPPHPTAVNLHMYLFYYLNFIKSITLTYN